MEFRDCDGCAKCCDGSLVGTAYGNKFGPAPCIYLKNGKCSIYETRPKMCQKYQCAWSQGLFPEWMKPDLTGTMCSVEGEAPRQVIRIVAYIPDDKVDRELDKFKDILV